MQTVKRLLISLGSNSFSLQSLNAIANGSIVHVDADARTDGHRGPRQHLRHHAGQFDWFFFSQAITSKIRFLVACERFQIHRIRSESQSFSGARTLRPLRPKIKQLLAGKYGEDTGAGAC